jgi:hypothetical protein
MAAFAKSCGGSKGQAEQQRAAQQAVRSARRSRGRSQDERAAEHDQEPNYRIQRVRLQRRGDESLA